MSDRSCRWSFRGCCRDLDGRSREGRLARCGRSEPGLPVGRTSTPKGAATAVEAPGDAVDEQCSRAEGVVGVEEPPDPASGGGGAA